MKEELTRSISEVVQELFQVEATVELTRPAEQFGDYATNVGLQLAKQLNQKPQEVASRLAAAIQERLTEKIESATVAGPGFINLKLRDAQLLAMAQAPPAPSRTGEVIVVEYSDPNPFKVLHAGHLYTSIIGDAMSNLLEQAGAKVHRVNFGGDVGLHVGKTMWAILQELGGEQPDKLQAIPGDQRSEWMATAYVRGTAAYDDDPTAKQQIIELNKRIYALHTDNDHDSSLAQIYWTCRQWSYDYFQQFYDRIGSHFERYYPESEVAGLGLQTVKEHIGTVFEESDGAIIFKGEAHDLHTRVFINSAGLPTYEAKDIGLVLTKWRDYQFNQSIVITGNEQEQYMAVVLKALEQFEPKLAAASLHRTHGIVKLKGGVKMSSRLGNILRAVDVLDAAAQANQELTGQADEQVVLGAVKYAFLKNRMGGDIIYDPLESVSLEGNSGPYLQYAHARAHSILSKASEDLSAKGEANYEPAERKLLRKLSEYPEVITEAVSELTPHRVCTYLYELSQEFNVFYEHNRVLGEERQAIRLQLVRLYANTLKSGLGLLGIAAPDKM